jgi:hypothetical protein
VKVLEELETGLADPVLLRVTAVTTPVSLRDLALALLTQHSVDCSTHRFGTALKPSFRNISIQSSKLLVSKSDGDLRAHTSKHTVRHTGGVIASGGEPGATRVEPEHGPRKVARSLREQRWSPEATLFA